MDKEEQKKKIREAIHKLREYGIRVQFGYMYNSGGETLFAMFPDITKEEDKKEKDEIL